MLDELRVLLHDRTKAVCYCTCRQSYLNRTNLQFNSSKMPKNRRKLTKNVKCPNLGGEDYLEMAVKNVNKVKVEKYFLSLHRVVGAHFKKQCVLNTADTEFSLIHSNQLWQCHITKLQYHPHVQ